MDETKNSVQVQCTRCRKLHLERNRVPVARRNGVSDLVCPYCGCKSFYDMTPQVAWCWASGLIEFGEAGAVPDAAIVIAEGPKSSLRTVLEILARRGRGASEHQLLVPGVPEADTQQEKGDALATWLTWCSKGNGRKGRFGVVFAVESGKKS